MIQLHEIQLEILKKLLFAETLRFVDMKPDPEMENSQFKFHLDRLIKHSLVEKVGDRYTLTTTGREYSNRADTGEIYIRTQAKISVVPCCVRTNGKSSSTEYLIYTRSKHPFFGAQGFPAGKVKTGESVVEAAERELKEETNLEGKAKLCGIAHYRVYTKGGDKQLEDKFMFLCLIKNPKGKIKSNPEGTHEWVKGREVKKFVKKPFPQFFEILDVIKKFEGERQGKGHSDMVKWIEDKHYVEGF